MNILQMGVLNVITLSVFLVHVSTFSNYLFVLNACLFKFCRKDKSFQFVTTSTMESVISTMLKMKSHFPLRS